MKITAISTHLPVWADDDDRRVVGRDEDEVTLAVAAALPLIEAGHHVDRLVVVTPAPSVIEGPGSVAIAHAVRRPDLPITVVLGGGPATVDVLSAATPGTVVVAVDRDGDAAATAVVVGDRGVEVTPAGSVAGGLPYRTRALGSSTTRVYDDIRLVRERGWKPVQAALSAGSDLPVYVSGFPQRDDGETPVEIRRAASRRGAAAPLMLIAALIQRGIAGRVIAIDAASGRALDLGTGTTDVHRCEPEPIPVVKCQPFVEAEIPISLTAYERAFAAKVGLLAGRCQECQALEVPPRFHCIRCGANGPQELAELPRRAEVYSIVTIRTAVPGVVVPYSLAIVAIPDTDVRLLGTVTDAVPGTTSIGAPGQLVLRKIADRQGVPDYGYSFRPDVAA